VATTQSLGLYRYLLAADGPGGAAEFVRRMIGPLLEYDAERGTDLARTLEAYLSDAVPTLPPVPGIDVAGYQASLRERFANRAIGDTVDRLCAFASDRIPAFVLPVVRDRLAQGLPVVASAAVVACWAHYRRGLDEAGRPLRPVDNRPLPAGAELLRHRAAVGDLADDPRFLDAARKALERLERGGVRALIG
jgi:mannitol 2-dehydrogenase